MAVTSRILGQRGKRQAEKLGIDPHRVPPGQYLTQKFPVLTVGPDPSYDLSSWDFQVFGEVESQVRLSWDELLALPQKDIVVDIHCVTRWSKLDTVWRGVAVRDLLERAGVKPSGKFVMAYSDGGYTTNLPLEAVMDDDVLVAHTYAGEPLEHEHGGAAAAARAQALLLEVGQVPAQARGDERGPDGILGAERLPQRRRSLERAAALVLGPS